MEAGKSTQSSGICDEQMTVLAALSCVAPMAGLSRPLQDFSEGSNSLCKTPSRNENQVAHIGGLVLDETNLGQIFRVPTCVPT